MADSPSKNGNGMTSGFVGAIFLTLGLLIFAVMVLVPAYQKYAARDWRETPCKILSSEVRAHRDHDGSTYSVEIVYAYEVAGRPYQSDRYQFLRLSTSNRQSRQTVAHKYRKGSQAVCYVNPRNPADAVLDRNGMNVGWWALFPLAFAGIGGGVLAMARRDKKLRALVLANPDEPWTQRADWAAGRIVSRQKGMGAALLGTAACLGLGGPIARVVLIEHPLRANHLLPGALVLIFPLIGLCFAAGFLWMGVRWLYFGHSIFEMTAVPGAVGGVLDGAIRLRRPIAPRGPVRLRLSCLSRATQRTNDGTTVTESVLWEHPTEMTVEPGATLIPVAFRIPADASPTSAVGSGLGVFWRLEASAPCPGISFKAQWEVPVYAMEVTPEEQSRAEQLDAVEEAAYTPPASSPIRVEPALEGGTQFIFPARRNMSVLLPLTLAFPFMSLVLVGLIQMKTPIIVWIGAAFFDVLFGLIFIHNLTAASRVRIEPGAVTLLKISCGIPRIQVIPVSDIREIRTAQGSISGGSTIYRNIEIVCQDESTVTLGTDVPDPREAEWLARQMSQALGLAAYEGETGR